MSCAMIRKLESDALDRQLTDDLESRYHNHLSVCEACRARYRQLASLQATLAQTSRVLAPQGLDRAVRSIWRPTLRPLPTVRLYPYLRDYLKWDFRPLRLVGHLAGFFLTVANFLVILHSFGDFSLQYGRIARPGVYTYLTRPSLSEPEYRNAAEVLAAADQDENYLLINLSVGAARLNDYSLERFAHGETEAFHEDSFSVITSTDSGGRSAIEGVLHSPRDPKLFVRFSQLLSTSQIDLLPIQANARGRVVWSFSRIFVTS